MCLALPGKVLEITDPRERIGRVEVFGASRVVNLGMLDDVAPGDWVVIQMGFAVEKIDDAQAQEMVQLFEELGRSMEQELVATGEEDGG
jgi:hydrogenase expression/formation protein HypC